jgi:hypothetical protein
MLEQESEYLFEVLKGFNEKVGDRGRDGVKRRSGVCYIIVHVHDLLNASHLNAGNHLQGGALSRISHEISGLMRRVRPLRLTA